MEEFEIKHLKTEINNRSNVNKTNLNYKIKRFQNRQFS